MGAEVEAGSFGAVFTAWLNVCIEVLRNRHDHTAIEMVPQPCDDAVLSIHRVLPCSPVH